MSEKGGITRRTGVLAFLLTPFYLQISGGSAAGPGGYKGRIVTEWKGDGRVMTLVEPFEYIDPSGHRWPVPAGTEVDGASIPKPFWSLIGGPFEGRYRDASVIHDYWCKARRRPHTTVHRVYDAMLTSGVGERRAWLMHQAVEAFGPSWDTPRIDPRCEIVDEDYDFTICARNVRPPAVRLREADREALQGFADRDAGQVDPDDLKALQDIARSEGR